MPVILAVEPDRRQAAHLAAIVRHRVGAELVLADTTERALDELGSRVPDMVLVPALLSPQDDAALAAALRVIAAAARVRTLTIPVLASGRQQSTPGGLLSRWRRGRAGSPAPDGCDPAVFAEQITAYLQEAAAERAELDQARERVVAVAGPPPAEDLPVAETLEVETLDDDPVIDLSPDLVTLSVDAPVEDLFAGEPFGTYTLPSMEEVEAEGSVVIEAAVAPEVRVVLDPPLVLEPPVAFESPVVFEPPAIFEPPIALESPVAFESPIVFEPPVIFESPVALEPPTALEWPVAFESPIVFEPPVIFESPIALESPVAFEPPVVFESPVAIESPVVFESPIVFEPPVTFEPPVAFEAPIAFEPSVAFEPPVVFESPVAFEQSLVFEQSVAFEPAVVVEPLVALESPVVFEPPVSFEHPTVLELMAPMPLTPWRVWPALEGVPIELPGIAAEKPEVPDWSELMASLRQDMERRRGHERTPVLKQKSRSKAAKPPVDEWGFFDPEQCGFSALLAKLDEITTA